MTTAADIVAEASEWIGTRWLHQAAVKGVATDCLGLIAGVGLACALPQSDRWRHDPRLLGYGRMANARVILAACDDYLDRVTGAPQLGDILLLRFAIDPQHFAIVSCLAPLRIIHAYASIGQVVENGVDGKWHARIVRTYRYRGLT